MPTTNLRFNVGDRVRCIKEDGNNSGYLGMVTTVEEIAAVPGWFRARYQEYIMRMECFERVPDIEVWAEENLRLLDCLMPIIEKARYLKGASGTTGYLKDASKSEESNVIFLALMVASEILKSTLAKHNKGAAV